jgi:hypothetical protein
MSVGTNQHRRGSRDRAEHRKLPHTGAFSLDQLNPIRPRRDVSASVGTYGLSSGRLAGDGHRGRPGGDRTEGGGDGWRWPSDAQRRADALRRPQVRGLTRAQISGQCPKLGRRGRPLLPLCARRRSARTAPSNPTAMATPGLAFSPPNQPRQLSRWRPPTPSALNTSARGPLE